MAYLTKEQILGADDIKTIDVEVPGWGGTVRIAEMNGNARDAYEMSLYNQQQKNLSMQSMRAKMVAYSIVGDDGKLMFSPKDIVDLGQKCAKSLDIVYEAAAKLNAMGNAEIEEAAKN